jgi:ATP-dependent DNA helicase RecG
MSDKISFLPVVNRIVIGDVGSGKTIVAFVTALTYLQGIKETSCQVAMIAPTEVLAFQHYQKLIELVQKQNNLLKDSNLHCIYLAGNSAYIDNIKFTPAKFKSKIQELLVNNVKLFWVGTHALLFNDQLVADLVMVDEQHRFGVRQRQKLAEKQNISKELNFQPHFISFTATPIPRTLALTVYNSLKPHFLQTLSDRNPILTSLKSFEELETSILEKVKNTIEQNKKVYIICPAVSEEKKDSTKSTKSAEEFPLWSVEKVAKIFNKYFENQVLEVHGKLADKKNILDEFKESKSKNILVATTVVEVGVDVREATLVVILNAERFGLSALHQIRGRVGRNSYSDNYCILVTYKQFMFSKRLKYICQLQDGFALAEKDLELRGSGDLIGDSQSGFGNDVDALIGLDPDFYQQLSDLVESIDYSDLSDLPRLKTYLEKEKNRVWEE